MTMILKGHDVLLKFKFSTLFSFFTLRLYAFYQNAVSCIISINNFCWLRQRQNQFPACHWGEKEILSYFISVRHCFKENIKYSLASELYLEESLRNLITLLKPYTGFSETILRCTHSVQIASHFGIKIETHWVLITVQWHCLILFFHRWTIYSLT